MGVVESPCIGVCRLDTASRICLGCGRTLDEISKWGKLNNIQKGQVIKQLPPRLERLKFARKAIGLGNDKSRHSSPNGEDTIIQ